MIYRSAALSFVLLASTISAYAVGQKGWSFKGTCSDGNVSESDGVQTGKVSGTMSTKDYLALMKRVRDSHLTLGADGFLWATQPLHCDSVIVMQIDDYEGHTAVSFSTGDPTKPSIIFAGGLIGGNGPLFLSDTVYLEDGKPMHLKDGSGNSCHFYFTNGAFTPGWQNRLTTIECELRMKTEAGRLISARVKFDVRSPPLP